MDRDDVEEAENALRAAMDSLAAREDAEVSDPEKQDVPEAEKNVTASDDRLKEKTGTAAFAGGSKAAKTGDAYDYVLWGAAVLLSVGVFTATGYRKKNR